MTRPLLWEGAIIIMLGTAVVAGGRSPAPAAASPKRIERQDDLARCQTLGEAAARDETCRRAWIAAREHFFGRAAS
ncbi:putative entry exclusion protein TrbK-alt [Caulobacter sp.]|uniref:putative entry exclusion protein TrbK-alt n=1 Tax=Caulobacter sp. TaxID=78 RepID=UPI0031CE5879